MPFAAANRITLAYEDYGSPDHPVVLLIMGLGAQLTLWPIELVEALVARKFRVIRYDNRDIGLSTKLDQYQAPPLPWLMLNLMLGRTPKLPYTLVDMATDGVKLLDSLGIERAHLVGASMGGMIAQLMAVNYPERVLSLTSIMSGTGNPGLPRGKPEALAVLTRRPTSRDEDVLVEYGVRARLALAGPAYPPDLASLRETVRANIRRGSHSPGAARQLAATLADGDRCQRLAAIQAPTLVIHGAEDPLVPLAAGEDTARSIRGAELKVIPGMGHDLPVALAAEIAEAIAGVARQAKSKASSRVGRGSRARAQGRARQ